MASNEAVLVENAFSKLYYLQCITRSASPQRGWRASQGISPPVPLQVGLLRNLRGVPGISTFLKEHFYSFI